MPITIRPSVVKIKKPSTGEYREINALLDTDSAKTVYYGVSSTAADTQTKTVTIEGISALSDGLLVRILFANAQSYSGVPKLKINSTAASNIKTRRGTDATNLTWKAGDVLDFVYDSSSSGFIVLDKGDIKDLNDAISAEATARENADDIILSTIAYVEETNTATRTYAVGDYVYIKQYERLYRINTATPSGTTLVGHITYLGNGGLNDLRTLLRTYLFGQNLAGGSSITIPRGAGASAIIYAIRANTSATPCLWIVDQWGGICAISNNTGLATLTFDSSNLVFILTNATGSYLNIGYIYLFP